MVKGLERLSEDERKALRGSKFAPLPPPKPSQPSSSSSSSSMPRIAHPGGPVATNKAVALAKFLERKLQEPGGLDNVKPELIELAVKNAKETVNSSGTSKRGVIIRHVTSFDSEDYSGMDEFKDEPKKVKDKKLKQKEKKRQKRKHKKLKVRDQI